MSPKDTSLPEVDIKVEVGKFWEDDQLLFYKNIRMCYNPKTTTAGGFKWEVIR